MAVRMSAIGNGKGMGFCSDRGLQSSCWVRVLGCSCGNSYPQFPNASILGMRNLLHLCDFSYYLNADFPRFPPPSCPSSNLLSPISVPPPLHFISTGFLLGRMHILLFLPIPSLLSRCWQFSSPATLTLSPIPSISSPSANTIGELCPFSSPPSSKGWPCILLDMLSFLSLLTTVPSFLASFMYASVQEADRSLAEAFFFFWQPHRNQWEWSTYPSL